MAGCNDLSQCDVPGVVLDNSQGLLGAATKAGWQWKVIELASDIVLHSPMLRSVHGKVEVEAAVGLAHAIQSASSYHRSSPRLIPSLGTPDSCGRCGIPSRTGS